MPPVIDGGPPAPSMEDAPVEERLAEIERHTSGTLPAMMSLALAQSTLPRHQLRRASTMLARTFDLPPRWFFPSFVPPTTGAPMRLFTDPVSGQAMSLATARRLLRAHEQPVIERMLREALVTPVEGTPRVGRKEPQVIGYEQTDTHRVVQAIRAFAPLRGEDLPFQVAFAMAIDIGASDLDVRAFAANLQTTASLEGLSPILAAEIARRGAEKGRIFRDAYDVAAFVAPGAAQGLELAKGLPSEAVSSARRAEVEAAAAAGRPIPATLTEVGAIPVEALLGQKIIAGLTMPGDFFASLQEAETDYVKAGKQIAGAIKIPFSDSMAGHAVGKMLQVSFMPFAEIMNTLGRIASGPAVGIDAAYMRDWWNDSKDIFWHRKSEFETLDELGIPPWLVAVTELFAATALDPVYLGLNALTRARAGKAVFGLYEAGKPEQWGAKVHDFLFKPVTGRLGGLRDTTIGQYLLAEMDRTANAERFYGRAVRSFRARFATEGIDPLVATRLWRFGQSSRRLGLSAAERLEGVNSILGLGLGIRPEAGSLAARISREVEAIHASTAEQLPLLLADGSRYTASETRLSDDAAMALGALDDASLDLARGHWRMLEIPHRGSPITRAEIALASSGLAETGLGRVMRSTFQYLPRSAGARYEIGLEQGTEAVRDLERGLRSSQVLSVDELSKARLEFSRALEPTSSMREVNAAAVIQRYDRLALERINARYGIDEGMSAQIIDAVQTRLGNREPQRAFAVFGEGTTETIERAPILSRTQQLNYVQLTDYNVYRQGVAETIGTWRKWRAAHLSAFGRNAPQAKAAMIPLRKFLDRSLDLVVRDLFLSWFKPLVVLRPAYLLRVVGLEEQSRFLGTLGFTRRVAAGKILSGERLGRVAPEVHAVEVPELAAFGLEPRISFTKPAYMPDDALFNQAMGHYAAASPHGLDKILTESLSPTAWGAVERSRSDFVDWWYNALNHQFGLDPLGRRYLDDVARGIGPEESVARTMDWLTSPGDGLREAKALMGGEYTRESLQIQVEKGVRYVNDLTRGHPELAAAARDNTLTAELLRAVPEVDRPPFVHGPLVADSVTSRMGPAKRFVNWYAKAILRDPTNRFTRQTFGKAWQDRVYTSLVETAHESGVGLTPEMLEGFNNTAREFAAGQVKRIMFDFTRQSRLDSLTRYVLMFVQPLLEFPVAWARVLRQNPAMAWAVARYARAAKESGFIQTDPETGELTVPLSWWAGAAPLLAAFTGGQMRPIAQGGGWELSAPLTSFNLFAQSTLQIPTGGFAGEFPVVMPSVNPEAMFVLQKMLSHSGLRADLKTRLSSWLFAYGPIDPSHPASLLPSYLRHGLEAAFPQWLENESNLQASHFLLLQQAMGLEPDEAMARRQSREFSLARAFFALVFPAAPRIEFPTAELETEWRHYVDISADYSSARKAFLQAHPGLDLITIARTMWSQENASPVSTPASAAVNQLLSTKGATRFAADHPSWVWAIIPSELRDGSLDPGAFFAQIASGQRVVLSPEQFAEKGAVQRGWDSYFALRESWIAWTEAHPLIGQGDPSYDEQYADFTAARDHVAETNPAWAAEFNTFELSGVQPRVMAEARNLAKDKMFTQTEVGKWLVGYLAMRDQIAGEMAKAGVHSLRTVTAARLGLTKRYDNHVEALNLAFPDGQTAYRLFFQHDLEHEKTPGDRALDKVPEDVFDTKITPWWTQYEILRDGPNQAPTEGARSDAFNAIRAYVELGYQQFAKGENPLVLRWATADPTYQQDYLVSLLGRPYAYLNRFDKTYLLKDRTTVPVEGLWTTYSQLRSAIAQREATDPEFSSTKAYEALGVWAATEAVANKTFGAQLAAANTWGYMMARVIADPKLSRGLFGTELAFSKPYWQAFLDAVGQLQGVVDAAKLGGSYDPKAKVAYNLLRGNLLGYVDTLKESSLEFRQQWDFLEEASGTDPLISYFMPEFSSYFGPVQGYVGGPR